MTANPFVPLTRNDLTKTQLAAIVSILNNHRAYDAKKGHDPDQTLTIQQWLEAWNDQEGRCAWTNMPMTVPDRQPAGSKVHKLNQASADRVLLDRGHDINNIILVTTTANLGRNDIPYTDYWDYMLSLTGKEPMFSRNPNEFED